MKDNPWFRELWKDASLGGLAGIGISLILLVSYNSFHFGFYFCLLNVIFGFLVGFLITLGNEIITGIIVSISPSYHKLMPIQLITTFITSSGIYFGLHYFYWLYTTGLRTQPKALFIYSLGFGIASLMISLFFIAKKNNQELLRLEKENRKLAVLEERSRIARELHDSVSQNLFGISLNLNTLNYLLERDLDESRRTVNQLQEMVQEVQSEMRLMIYELRPLSLITKSFFEGTESLVNLFRSRYHIDINCQLIGKEEDLDSKAQMALFRVLQEALNNTIKHAKAGKITVVLKVEGHKAEMTIQDNGLGFDPAKVKTLGCIGISGMRERIQELGGKFEITSQLGIGTFIKVQI